VSNKEAKDFITDIDKLIEMLPEELGIVKPYIYPEDKKRPIEHDYIFNILKDSDIVGIGGSQGDKFDLIVDNDKINEKLKEIDQITDNALKSE